MIFSKKYINKELKLNLVISSYLQIYMACTISQAWHCTDDFMTLLSVFKKRGGGVSSLAPSVSHSTSMDHNKPFLTTAHVTDQ